MKPAVGDGTRCEVCHTRLTHWCERLGRRIWRCAECGHIAVLDGVAMGPDGRSIYESDESIFHLDGNAEYYLDETNMRAAEAKVRFVRKYWTGTGRLLDVGASFGHFLHTVGAGCDAWGCELSPNAVTWSRQHFGVRNQIGSAYAIPPGLEGPFDAITCWDVIEHLEHPVDAVAEMRKHLQDEGWLFLSTPDAGSTVARLLGRRWHYLDPIQHLNLFSRDNLQRVLQRSGFRVEGHAHLGHEYRINYIVNRLTFLAGNTRAAVMFRKVATGLPESVKRRRVWVNVRDVVVVAARRTG